MVGDGLPARYARSTKEAFARWLSSPRSTRQLVVVFCVAVTVVAVVIRYPEAFRAVNDTARANAALDYLDRQVGAGNSVLPDQGMAIQARGLIPPNGTFTVSFGERREGWSELAVPHVIEPFMRYFLLPRRESPDAPWILCFACDHGGYPDAQVVWEDAEGLSILRQRE